MTVAIYCFSKIHKNRNSLAVAKVYVVKKLLPNEFIANMQDEECN